MMTALSRVFLLVGISLLSLDSLQAQGGQKEPPIPSDDVLALLLSYESRVLPQHISIGIVVRGEASLGEKFGTHHSIHVTFIWPIAKDGRRVREVATEIRELL